MREKPSGLRRQYALRRHLPGHLFRLPLRSRRVRLLEIERIRELMGDDSPVDRMSRGLLPSDAYGEDVKFLI